jgi:hypothetical protein
MKTVVKKNAIFIQGPRNRPAPRPGSRHGRRVRCLHAVLQSVLGRLARPGTQPRTRQRLTRSRMARKELPPARLTVASRAEPSANPLPIWGSVSRNGKGYPMTPEERLEATHLAGAPGHCRSSTREAWRDMRTVVSSRIPRVNGSVNRSISSPGGMSMRTIPFVQTLATPTFRMPSD